MANETRADARGQQPAVRPTAKARAQAVTNRWLDYLAQRAEKWATPSAPLDLTASMLLTEAQASGAVMDYLTKLRDFAAKE
jgi:hypothetical protein